MLMYLHQDSIRKARPFFWSQPIPNSTDSTPSKLNPYKIGKCDINWCTWAARLHTGRFDMYIFQITRVCNCHCSRRLYTCPISCFPGFFLLVWFLWNLGGDFQKGAGMVGKNFADQIAKSWWCLYWIASQCVHVCNVFMMMTKKEVRTNLRV